LAARENFHEGLVHEGELVTVTSVAFSSFFCLTLLLQHPRYLHNNFPDRTPTLFGCIIQYTNNVQLSEPIIQIGQQPPHGPGLDHYTKSQEQIGGQIRYSEWGGTPVC
jgi:hypothetical protein